MCSLSAKMASSAGRSPWSSGRRKRRFVARTVMRMPPVPVMRTMAADCGQRQPLAPSHALARLRHDGRKSRALSRGTYLMASAGTSRVPLTGGLSSLDGRYDGLLVDLWGCLHNGIRAWPAAVEALQRFRAGGGLVVLLSNAPRTDRAIAGHWIDGRPGRRLGRHHDGWPCGTVGRRREAGSLFAALGPRFWHVGKERDATLLEGLGHERATSVAEANFVLCCGIRANGETLADIMPELEPALERDCRCLSANPTNSSCAVRPARSAPAPSPRPMPRAAATCARRANPIPRPIADASTCWEACLPSASCGGRRHRDRYQGRA